MDPQHRKTSRWLIGAVLAAPTLALFAYSLSHPGVKGKDDRLFTVAEKQVPALPHSPWVMQESGTSAGLRGIYSVDGKVAWASGTEGTVLRTLDGGAHWTKCAVPDAATDGATLDFRGVQAWDEQTAIVMASGRGDKSRLYKTIDGCKTWMLLFTNPDRMGFWDGLQFVPATGRDQGRIGYLIGDPIDGKFTDFISWDYGKTWSRGDHPHPKVAQANDGEALFAASNSAMILIRNGEFFVTGGSSSRSRTLELHVKHDPTIYFKFVGGNIPLKHCASAGAFSVAARLAPDSAGAADLAKFIIRVTHSGDVLVSVGGDYTKPSESLETAAWTADGGLHWTAATKPPHGYRSSVQWSEDLKAWITVGTNGSDISRDDGKTWTPLDDGNWNALSLPFVVGPKGRIARLSLPAAK
jgi:photosystem II stability/assembly factor-like uncharacterized protein